MKARPFGGWNDLRAMQELCSVRLRAAPGRAVAHPGDIAWWAMPAASSPELLAERFLLWEDDDGVLDGFAAFDPDEGALAVFVAPDLADGEAAVRFEDASLAWADRGIEVAWLEFEDDVAAVGRWRARGFQPTDRALRNLVRSLDDLPETVPDERVRAVGDADVEDRVRITHDAFEDLDPFPSALEVYRAFRASPAYPEGWDLLLHDDDGRAAACCLAWPDPASGASTFEPVATHPSMHGRGFGRALLTEGLRRFRAAGMTWAIVGVDVENPAAEALYRSVGFRPDRVLREYRRA